MQVHGVLALDDEDALAGESVGHMVFQDVEQAQRDPSIHEAEPALAFGSSPIDVYTREGRQMNDVLDWDLLISSRLNAILCGNRSNLEVTFSRLCGHLALPLHEWSFAKGSPLPSMTKGTLMVTDLGASTLEEQRVFLEWLNPPRAVRVITLSEVPLFDLVAAGALLEQLYYRLNPIYCALDRNYGSGSEATRRHQRDLNSRSGSSASAAQ